jgi:hypothetical protein
MGTRHDLGARLLAWLREPDPPPGPPGRLRRRLGSKPDDLDLEAFGRSFGRMIGGNVNLGRGPKPPDRPQRRLPPAPGPPRWAGLLLLAWSAFFLIVVGALVVLVLTH